MEDGSTQTSPLPRGMGEVCVGTYIEFIIIIKYQSARMIINSTQKHISML